MINKEPEIVKINMYDCHTYILVVYSLGDKVLLRFKRTPEELAAGIAVLRRVAKSNPLFSDIFSESRQTNF